MEGIAKQLSAVVADAITCQVGLLDEDSEADRLAQQQTASELVRAAIASGQVSEIHMAGLQSFTSGATAMLVARVETSLSFVVKVDRSPQLVSEAHLLRRAGTDLCLPEATRRCFPRVYAIDDVGPIYGYLMENLEGYQPLWQGPSPEDGISHEAVVGELWRSVLGPAYQATKSTRLAPNVAEDYFVRAGDRLSKAAASGLLPGPTTPLRIECPEGSIEVTGGWGPLLSDATEKLRGLAPTFSSFVHGDPNPENVLWRRDGEGISFRLIDPKDWWSGDYIFDVAKLVHYFKVTLPVESANLPAELSWRPDLATVGYDPAVLAGSPCPDTTILEYVEQFASEQSCPDPAWRERLDLAIAANLLGIVGPRLTRARETHEPGDRNLALIALGEGLRLLACS